MTNTTKPSIKTKKLKIFIITFLSIVILYWIVVLVVSNLFYVPPIPKGMSLYDYCDTTFKQIRRCPSEKCKFGCVPGNDDSLGGIKGEGCSTGCFPKPCYNFSVRECPLDRCKIIVEYTGEKVCF